MYELMAEADSGSVGATEMRYCGGAPLSLSRHLKS
jgi:hypothetical protein